MKFWKKSFTLIELLVVIAIIAILASMLLPALQKAKAKALQASCMSQEKQLALAVKMYEDDAGNRMPYAITHCWGGTHTPRDECVAYMIRNYVGDDKVFEGPAWTHDWCGGHGIPHHAVPQAISAGLLPNTFVQTYGFVEDSLVHSRKEVEYKKPSETVMLGDSSGYINTNRLACTEAQVCWVTGGGCTNIRGLLDPAKHCRHNGGSNVAFMDGHVKWYSGQSCFNLQITP